MSRTRWVAAAVTLGLVLLATGPAQGATMIGQLSPPGSPLGCEASTFIVQTGTVAGNDYRVPLGGGVITEWSMRSWTKGSPDQLMQLALFGSDVSGDNVTFLALSGIERVTSVEGFEAHSFKTQVPVSGGERLGLYAQPGSFFYTCVHLNSEKGDRIIWGKTPPPTIGGPPVFASFGEVIRERIPVEAKLEPDADHDNFGDETQDLCPTDAATHGPCPVPDTSITRHPKAKTKSKKAAFEFASTIPGSSFECQLDKGPFAPCASPYQAKVAKGKHSFAVRATVKGLTDASPATFSWKVQSKKKRHKPRHH